MLRCGVHRYPNWPASPKVKVAVSPVVKSPVSKAPPRSVAECRGQSSFTHVTLSPALIVISASVNFILLITTVCVVVWLSAQAIAAVRQTRRQGEARRGVLDVKWIDNVAVIAVLSGLPVTDSHAGRMN